MGAHAMRLSAAALIASALVALSAPAASPAAPAGVAVPPWFEQAIAAGTLARGSNCDWTYQETTGTYPVGYIWILPATLAGSVYAPPSTFGAAMGGTSCRRNLSGGLRMDCAAWQQGHYLNAGTATYDLSALCTVNSGQCLRQYYHSQSNDIVYVNDDRGSLDCGFTNTKKKCRKKRLSTREASASKKRKCHRKKGRSI